MSARFKNHPNYAIGHADGVAGKPVNPEFKHDPPYCEGWTNGEYFRKQLERRGFEQVASELGSITFSIKL